MKLDRFRHTYTQTPGHTLQYLDIHNTKKTEIVQLSYRIKHDIYKFKKTDKQEHLDKRHKIQISEFSSKNECNIYFIHLVHCRYIIYKLVFY